MVVRQTSIEAYREIRREGKTGQQAGRILEFLKDNKGKLFTRNEISRSLNISINAVCGRINELLKAGYIIEAGKIEDKYTHKSNMGIVYNK